MYVEKSNRLSLTTSSPLKQKYDGIDDFIEKSLIPKLKSRMPH
jgi:hypothetical protein